MTTIESKSTRLLHVFFDERATKVPDSPALIDGGRSITYAELQQRSMDVTAALRDRGVEDGSLVGVHLERSASSVATVLGILRSGAAVVPIPPAYPAERARRIVSFGGIDLIVDDEETPAPDGLTVPRLSLRDVVPGATRQPSDSVAPRAPAFVLSSSGSTGHPKIIVRSHESFFHRLEWTWRRHPFEGSEVGCQKAPMATTHSVYELFEPLLVGTPVVIVRDHEVRNLEAFWEIVRSSGVTRLLIVPSMLQASLAMPDLRVPELAVVVLMGEYVAPEVARIALHRFSEDVALYSIYGSTEASSVIVCDLRESFTPGEELPLGRRISADVTLAVLDDGLDPVPAGEIGRLHVAGLPLFSRYLNDPQLTSEVVNRIDGERYYDTRDDVRVTDDGRMLFVGRVDDTVKVRGFRVDLPEIERTMLGHPDVTQAAVVASRSDLHTTILAGFYSPATVDADEVSDTLRSRLPEYMVPSTLNGIDALPVTPSGKVHRVRLLEIYEERRGDEFVAHSRTEERVADGWERTLGHRLFRSDSNFFQVGGTSLSVFRLTQHLREIFGLERERLGEDAVYRHPTLETLSRHVERRLAGSTAVSATEGQPILVSLRKGRPDLEPLFLIASAGGTLGAYDELARTLETDRELIGIRDPMIWGERDPLGGFDRWVDQYLDAVTAEQTEGPYHLCAYSSAGAFGYEMARRLEAAGERVALLALIDPLGIGFRDRPGFGYWAMRATWMGSMKRRLVRLVGSVRVPLVRLLSRLGDSTARLAGTEARGGVDADLLDQIRRSKEHVMNLAALMEMNSGLSYSLAEDDFEDVPPDRFLDVLKSRVSRESPEIGVEMIERVAIQYEVQVRSQHAYRLQPYDGRVFLAEPSTGYAGLLSALLRPYVSRLESRVLPLGDADADTAALLQRFGGLAGHYRSMRDESFVGALSEELEARLEA